MAILIWTIIAVTAVGLAVTLRAVLTAPEGVEDHTGFHAIAVGSVVTSENSETSTDTPLVLTYGRPAATFTGAPVWRRGRNSGMLHP